MNQFNGTLDLILNTVSINHKLNPYLSLLRVEGTYVVLGLLNEPYQVNATDLLYSRKKITGSLVGGL